MIILVPKCTYILHLSTLFATMLHKIVRRQERIWGGHNENRHVWHNLWSDWAKSSDLASVNTYIFNKEKHKLQ
jgi:hypothetical protein